MPSPAAARHAIARQPWGKAGGKWGVRQKKGGNFKGAGRAAGGISYS